MSGDPLTVACFASQREHLLIVASAGYARPVAELPDKLAAVLAAVGTFADCGVPYALIGGLAVGIRSGVPRATLDVDFAIPTRIARPWLSERMAERGFRSRGEFSHSLNFEHESGEPVQLAFDPQFDEMIERSQEVRVGELALRVVTREDLLTMKRRAASDPGRRRSKALRDQADIALLEGDVGDEHEGW
jgi:hypothetical protein